jgi:hypothetical protein
MVFFSITTIDSFVFWCFLLFVVGATPYLVVQVGDLLEVEAFWFLLTCVHFSSIFSSKQSHIVISCTIRILFCESLIVYATMNTCELHHQLLHFRYVFNYFPKFACFILEFLFLFVLCYLWLLMCFFFLYLVLYVFICLR